MSVKKIWETLKSGVRRNGHWHIGQYLTGWFLWNNKGETFGPFKSLDDVMKEQEKK